MRLAIADPPYLDRAVRWYGEGGTGYTAGSGQADNHPEAYLWDIPKTHQDLARRLEQDYDGYAIAMSVHSLSTYLSVIETNSRNGIRVGVWNKTMSLPSASRIHNSWEPVIFKIPKERRARNNGTATKDVLTSAVLQNNFIGAKPLVWTEWVLDVLGYKDGDQVDDLFAGSGAVSNAIKTLTKERLF